MASYAPSIAAALLATAITPAGAFAQSLEWDGAGATANGTVEGGSGTWDAATANWTSDGGTTNEAWNGGDVAVFGGTAGTVTVSGTQDVGGLTFQTDGYAVTGGTVNFVSPNTGITVETGVANIGSDITSATGLVKSGEGELILSGDLAINGALNLADGRLTFAGGGTVTGVTQVSAQSAFTSIHLDMGGADLNVQGLTLSAGSSSFNNGTFTVSTITRLGTGESDFVLAGTGELLKAFATTFTLNGQSTLSGPVNVDGGELVISATGGLNNADAITIASGATLNVDGGGNNALSDTAIIDNSGTLELTGSDETIGAIFGSGNINLNANTLTFGDGTDREISGVISGSGVLDFSGSEQLVLSGNSTMTGTIAITGGGLVELTGSTMGGVSMTTNGTFDNFGTVSGNVYLEDGEFNNGEASGFTTGSVGGAVWLNGAFATFNNNQGSSVSGAVTVDNGTLYASGGTFGAVTVNGGAMTIFDDTVASSVTMNAGDIDILSGWSLTTTLSMAGGTTNNDGTVTGTVTVTSGTFNNGDVSGTPSGTVAGDVLINGAGGIFNNYIASDVTGTVTLDDDDGNPSTGGTLNGDGGTFGDVVVNDGTFNVNADAAADNVTNNGGVVAIDGGGVTLTTNFVQAGGTTTIATGGVLDDTDGTVMVSGGVIQNEGLIDDAVNIAGGEVQNNGGGTISGLISVTGGTLTASGGTFGGDVAISGTGTFNVDGNTGVGTTTITGGDIDVSFGTTLQTDLVQSGGTTTIQFDGTLTDADGTILTGGLIDNDGNITNAVTIDGGTLTNNAGGAIDDETTVLSGTLNAAGGFFGGGGVIAQGGTVNVTVSQNLDLINEGSDVNILSGVTLTDDLVNNDGVLTNDGTVAGTVQVNGGTVTNTNTGFITGITIVQGGTLNAAGGSFGGGVIAQGGTVNVTVSQALDLTNDGSDINVLSGITLTDDVVNNDGTLTNEGTIAGTVQVNGGTFNQGAGNVTGAVTVTGTGPTDRGELVLSGGSLDAGAIALVDGDIVVDGAASGDITNDGGIVTIANGGNLTGDLTHSNGATGLENGGTLTGSLNVTGNTVTVAGAIVEDPGDADAEGVTVSAGTLVTETGADIQLVTTQTGGTINANGGNFSGGIVGQAGNLNIAGTVGADILVEGSVVDVTDTGVLTGNVTMATGATTGSNSGTVNGTVYADAGTFFNTGSIVGGGAVEVDGGTFSNDADGSIAGDVTVADGTFLANGGSMNGTALVTGTGQYTVIANSSGNVQNGTAGGGAPTGGTVLINTGQTLTGDVANYSGTTEVVGTINGTLDLGGGTATTNAGSGVTGLVTVSGGTFTANGGTFGAGILATGGSSSVEGEITIASGALTSDDGSVTIASGSIVNGNVATTNSGGVADAFLQNDGTINGTATSNAGLLLNTGTLTGAAIVNGGELANTGQMQGGFAVNGGLLSLDGAGSISGTGAVNSGGVFLVNGGTFNDGVENNGGVIEIAGDSSGIIWNTAGDARIDPDVTFTGDVINGPDGSFDLATGGSGTAAIRGLLAITGGPGTGTIDGSLTNNGGLVNLNGTITGGTTNSGATAEMRVASGDVAIFGIAPDAGLINSDYATLIVSGTASGEITNEETGRIALAGGTFAAGSVVENAGLFSVTGASVADGTVRNGGTLVVGDDAGGVDAFTVNGTLTNLSGGLIEIERDGSLDAATFTNETGSTINLYGAISGAMTNAGTFSFFGDGTGADAARFGGLFTNAETGMILVHSGNLTFGNGLSNAGMINLSAAAATTGDIASVNGTYTGGGEMLIDVDFAGDSADRLVVDGDVTGGSTAIFVNDVSTGEVSGNDIVIASVTGTAAADAFTLATPLVFGAYNYDIAQIGSDFILGAYGGFVGEVVGLEALAHSLLLQSDLPSLRQRSGLSLVGDAGEFGEMRGIWLITDTTSADFSPSTSGTAYQGEMDEYRMRGGLNFSLADTDAGQLVVGASMSYSSADTSIGSQTGSASIDTDAVSTGVSATWFGRSGLYVDGQFQYTIFESTVDSAGFESSTDGNGYSGGIEIGKRIMLADSGWTLTPQGHVTYNEVTYDGFTSGGGLSTTLDSAESLTVGLGVTAAWNSAAAQGLSLYGIAMVDRELAGEITAFVAESPVATQTEDWFAEAGLGVRHGFGNGRASLYGEVSYAAGLDNPGDNNGLSLVLGGRISY
ncbi:hypothetical protein [Alteraurantiacibacter aquimixticola]|uniref:Autotransporter domain-containing protein n=1 Tax=Alteraurantiacibacter aquimixticola TaxID=2489173 RepID=A0A4T3F1A7_9SPHN|nr:hypothetical protein [Alteraurantiacibacter aquimixticola]TIX49717.1 hypothetical protein E5222_12960 [Alteraurantiacibacter aquimixticola]